MTRETQNLGLSAILCADWGKDSRKRALYVADVAARVVRRVGTSGWSVTAVLEEAERWASSGPVLATFDAPLGIPESYLAAAARIQSWGSPKTFLEFLTRAHSTPRFFDGTSVAADWKVERPFFAVPSGKGGLTSYRSAAAQQGVDLYRAIDKTTGAKTLFAKSGIPGSVGSAACALWQELGPRLARSRTFRVWPFEGDLEILLKSGPVVVGEIYPRAAYATALLDASAALRSPLALAKTDANVRCKAIATLRAAEWVRLLGVTIESLVDAQTNEDDFDACMTAAALLRCVLDKVPLCLSRLDSARTEGGMLGTASVNLQLHANGLLAQEVILDDGISHWEEPSCLLVNFPPLLGTASIDRLPILHGCRRISRPAVALLPSPCVNILSPAKQASKQRDSFSGTLLLVHRLRRPDGFGWRRIR